MDRIGTCYLMPHPPIIIPEIGRGEELKVAETLSAMEEVAQIISVEKPDVIVLITPHGPVFRDAVAVGMQEEFSGSFANFGRSDVSLSLSGHPDMAYRVMEESTRNGIPVVAVDASTAKRYGASAQLDHGALVPLYYISKRHRDFRLVHITYGLLPPAQLYAFGRCIQGVIQREEGKTAVVCSGDLSHRLIRGAPAGYSKRGAEFDEKLVSYLARMDVKSVLEMDAGLIEEAGECGYRSILILLGTLDGYDVESRILSYEGPFGVGYCVSTFKPVGRNPAKGYEDAMKGELRSGIEKVRQREDEYVRLAREALEHYVKYGGVIKPPPHLPKEMLETRAGVFVSIKKSGQLRGCIGTISPTSESIAQEVIDNAISAGTRDPRFYPVQEKELDALLYSVDVLGEPEAIQSIGQLDVKRYGVIVRAGRRSGLLLPDIEGVETPEDQVGIALRKAGMRPAEPYVMERFEVIRHH